eukprot:1185221-Prorocentrum_minimum.AAC.2
MRRSSLDKPPALCPPGLSALSGPASPEPAPLRKAPSAQHATDLTVTDVERESSREGRHLAIKNSARVAKGEPSDSDSNKIPDEKAVGVGAG